MLTQTARGIADAVRGRPGGGVVPGFLRPIDTGAIARSEKLDEKATENGSAELPDASAKHPDSPEQGVTQKVLSEWAWQGGAFLNELRAYADRLAQYSIHSEHERLRLLANDAIAKLGNASVRAPAELGPLKEAYLGARQELDSFKTRHGLDRPARKRSRRWTTFGLMFVLIAVESVVNGIFFAKGSQFGLLGGVGTAIGISIANVLFAFLLGFGLARWVNYRNFLVRGSAFLLTVAGVGLIVALHAFAAQFRDAMAPSIGEDRAFALAIEQLMHAPWRVSSETSIYLFGLGLLFGLGAFWKGCTFDDPYPGYGPMDRRAVSAREEYSDQHAYFFDELQDIKDQAVEELKTGIAQVPLFPQRAENIRSQRAALVESFRAYETAAEAAANQLLARYRTANRRSRKTAAPAYFEDTWKLPHRFVDSAEAKQLIVDPGPSPTIEPILADFRKLSEAIFADYAQLNRQFPHPTEMQ